jgi:hypothetical protein
MSIIIKELFGSDLDQYNTNWWSSKKIEKLNFNFDQILISGGGLIGPHGFPGDQGLDGAKGPIGPQGEMGPQGEIGSQGADGETIWLKNESSTIENITLKINQFGKYNATNFLFGIPSSTDPLNEYNVPKIGILGKIHTKGGLAQKNIVFSDEEANDRIVSVNLFKENQDTILEYGFDNTIDTEFDLISDEAVLTYNVNPSITSTFGKFKASLFNIKTINLTFGNTTEINEIRGSTKFNTENPITNWIAQSFDNNGKIKWVDPLKVIPGFPVGSIIAINADQFNNNNFLLNETKTVTTDYLQNTNGSGKTNTMYQGWYICNGKTWKKGVITYDLPNLNSYSYNIDADTSGNSNQEHVNVSVNKLSILGGSDLRLDLTQSGGSYSSSYTNHATSNQTEIFNSDGSLSQSDAKLIYICYLKETDMYWEDAIIIPPAPTLYDINLSYSAISNANACSNPSTAYKVDFDPSLWTNLSANLSGKLIYNSSGNAIAVDGYYSKDGIVRTFVGGSFVYAQNCPIIYSFIATLGPNMFNLNGSFAPYSGTNMTLYADNNSFTSATKLYTDVASTPLYYAPNGWYRVGLYRRYWSQVVGKFLGTDVFGDYIFNILASQSAPNGDYMAKASSKFNYCNQIYSDIMYLYTDDSSFMSTDPFLGPVYKNLYNLTSNEGYEPIELIENNAFYGPENDVFYRQCADAGVLQQRYKCTGSII